MTRTANLVALHTSDPRGAVAIGWRGRIHARALPDRGERSHQVLECLRGLLAAAQAALEGFEGVAVSRGPGSFTGIRMGLAAAQGLALARGWTVRCTDSLRVVAAAAPGDATLPVAVALDARRGEVYASLHAAAGGAPAIVSPTCAPPDAAAESLVRRLSAAGAAACRLAGSGSDALQPLLDAAGVRVQRVTVDPAAAAESLVRLAQAGACDVVPPEALQPLYLRASDAEIQRAARQRPR